MTQCDRAASGRTSSARRSILGRFMRYWPRPQPASLVRASSRRIMTMKAGFARSSNIRVIYRRLRSVRLLPARSHSEKKKLEARLDGSLHIKALLHRVERDGGFAAHFAREALSLVPWASPKPRIGSRRFASAVLLRCRSIRLRTALGWRSALRLERPHQCRAQDRGTETEAEIQPRPGGRCDGTGRAY